MDNQTFLKTKYNTSKTVRVETCFLPDQISALYHQNRHIYFFKFANMWQKKAQWLRGDHKKVTSRSHSPSFTRHINNNITSNRGSGCFKKRTQFKFRGVWDCFSAPSTDEGPYVIASGFKIPPLTGSHHLSNKSELIKMKWAERLEKDQWGILTGLEITERDKEGIGVVPHHIPSVLFHLTCEGLTITFWVIITQCITCILFYSEKLPLVLCVWHSREWGLSWEWTEGDFNLRYLPVWGRVWRGCRGCMVSPKKIEKLHKLSSCKICKINVSVLFVWPQWWLSLISLIGLMLQLAFQGFAKYQNVIKATTFVCLRVCTNGM